MKTLEFLSEKFQFLEVKFSIYLNRHVFMITFHIRVSALHYKNTPIQICRKFHLPKLKNFR